MIFLLLTILLIVFFLWWAFWRKKHFIEAHGLAIFISGCDTGIGHRLAIYFSEIGCEVFAGCLNPESARNSLPDSIHVIPLDVTSEDSVRSAVHKVRNILDENDKDLWCLVNNAGVCVFGQLEWQTWEQCERQIRVNVLGTIRLTKACIPLLRRSKGRIITMSSINGSIAYPGLSVYSASKFALEGLCAAARVELYSQHGIRVIIVQPGDYARLTSIMARHQQNAQEMWDDMSVEDQRRYDDFFHKYNQQTLKNYGLTSPNSFESSNLLEVMREATLGFNPRSKYVSASLGCRMVYAFLMAAPSTFLDFILSKIVNTLYNS